MTREEFDAWSAVTERSTRQWNLDSVTLHNRGIYLFYKGGENGHYIQIYPNGKTEFGDYEGAIPHIGESMFTPTFTVKWKHQDEALRRLQSSDGGKLNLL